MLLAMVEIVIVILEVDVVEVKIIEEEERIII
jgi:hypothetical protein